MAWDFVCELCRLAKYEWWNDSDHLKKLTPLLAVLETDFASGVLDAHRQIAFEWCTRPLPQALRTISGLFYSRYIEWRAALTTADARASYSNFGSCLDIFGPGSNILSTTPNGGTATYSGTSMAAPHVAGVAAVVLSLRDYTPSALATYLTEVATTGVVSSAGTGSPNLLAYIPPASSTPTPSDPDPVATIPAQPDAPVGESRNKAIVVSWSIPADGGAPISAQTVRTYTNGRLVSSLTVDGATSSTRVSRLRNGVDYTFTVQARNSVGAGLESAPSAPVRPAR